MSQYDYGDLESPLNGATFFNTHLEPWRNAVHSNHAGSSRPSYAGASMVWVNDSTNPHVINYFDGSDDIPTGRVDTSTNICTHVGNLRSPGSGGINFYNHNGTLIATYGAGGSTGVSFKGQVNFEGLIQVQSKFALKDAGELTIASGVVTITAASHTVDTESDAASDDLGTINGGTDGAIVTLRPAHTDRTVVLKHGTGNINTPDGSDITLDSTDRVVALQYDLELTKWLVLAKPAMDVGGVPTGTVLDYAGSTVPSGYLLCYGQDVSRTTYSALFAAIGTTYGSGDGSTTFTLPPASGRVVAGKDDMGGTPANLLTGVSGSVDGTTLGATGGSETYTQTSSTLYGHAHSEAARGIDTGSTYTASAVLTNSMLTGSTSTGSAGSSQAMPNVQPTLVLNKIIKT